MTFRCPNCGLEKADGAGSWIWCESLQEPVPVCPDCRPVVVMEPTKTEAEKPEDDGSGTENHSG